MKTPALESTRLARARDLVRERLCAERNELGHWRGELSNSALSTATATFALHLAGRHRSDGVYGTLVKGGCRWLAANTNSDGGWGDTVRSQSNLSTTTLAWAALEALARSDGPERLAAHRAGGWIERRVGSLEPTALARAIADSYGDDRTFSIPILTMAALAGRLGEGRQRWAHVAQLPFELAVVPRSWFRHIGLPVVSYALPALIAVGQVRHAESPTRILPWRWVRGLCRRPTLRLLRTLQPIAGGFLEAVPLTAFVTMSLLASGAHACRVVEEGLDFIARSVRPDGSWPIDTDLATWVTTLSVNAMAAGGDLEASLSNSEQEIVREWLLGQQYTEVHPYTDARPGGWAWTDLPGGVPDADDTAGALLALRQLGRPDTRVREAAARGAVWLLDLQNRDGGVPTFCRGWGKLPFDRSGADLTAHALRAWLAWRNDLRDLPPRFASRCSTARLDAAITRGLRFLHHAQGADGSWRPLWFGNESVEGFENPVFGTARVLLALRRAVDCGEVDGEREMRRGTEWLLEVQNDDGGWGGAAGVASSVEETALALEAQVVVGGNSPSPAQNEAIGRGADWLLSRIEAGEHFTPTPIGFYFAKLWYFERLYPHVFALGALERLCASGL